MSRKKILPLVITALLIAFLLPITIPDIMAAVVIQGSAELKFLRHSVSPETPLPGARFSIEVSIQNAGKGKADSFRVEARSGQTTLGVTEFKGLSPGARDSQSISLTYPDKKGEICLDLIINPLKNKDARVDSPRRVCVSAKTIARPQPLPQQPPSPGEEPSIPIQPQIPTPSKPEAPLKPVEIKIASLDVSKGKFELELENRDKKRDLRNPLVEVEINQAGKKRQLYKDYLPSLPADGTRLIRIPVPEDTKPTDSLEIKVNDKLIGKKGLKGLLDEALLQKLGKEKIKPIKPPENIQPLAMYMRLQVNGSPVGATVPVGGSANLTWSLPEGATNIFLRVRITPFPGGESCSGDAAAMNAADGFSNPDSGYRPGGSHGMALSDPRYVVGNTYYVMGCFWNRETVDYTGDWTNTVEIQYGFLSVTATEIWDDIPAVTTPEPTHWAVTAHLARIEIVNRCDNVSAGDWFFQIKAGAGYYGRPSARPGHSSTEWGREITWPRRALDLHAGDIIVPARIPGFGESSPASLAYVPYNPTDSFRGGYVEPDSVSVIVKGWECDTGGWRRFSGVCRNAEEFPEIGPGGTAVGGITRIMDIPRSWWDPRWAGAPGYLGPDHEYLMPEPTIRGLGDGYLDINNCGDGAYRAWIRLTVRPVVSRR